MLPSLNFKLLFKVMKEKSLVLSVSIGSKNYKKKNKRKKKSNVIEIQ